MSGRLQQEIKKRNPFESLEEETFLNLVRTSDRLQNRHLRLFREFDLTPSQYNILRILRGEGKPLPSLEIASRMLQVVPAITGLVDRLEKAGFVKRQRCEQDRRVVYIELTRKGDKVMESLQQPLDELTETLLGHLTKKEHRQLIALLEKAREKVRD